MLDEFLLSFEASNSQLLNQLRHYTKGGGVPPTKNEQSSQYFILINVSKSLTSPFQFHSSSCKKVDGSLWVKEEEGKGIIK